MIKNSHLGPKEMKRKENMLNKIAILFQWENVTKEGRRKFPADMTHVFSLLSATLINFSLYFLLISGHSLKLRAVLAPAFCETKGFLAKVYFK